MLRFLGFATLVLVAICLAIGASIALAADGAAVPADAQDRTVEAIDPDRRMIDDSLVSLEDVYEFDFAVKADAEPNQEFPTSEFDESSDLLEI
jgi:hypothetical protein